jgi:hypothetical protein
MKLNFLLSLLLLATACNPFKDEYYVRTTSQCDIIHYQLPDTIALPDSAQISAVAQAGSACWSNLGFLLSKTTDFEYYLQAFGVYESYGSCPEVIITADSVIKWKPTQTGLYKFHVFKTPYEVETDTIIVK